MSKIIKKLKSEIGKVIVGKDDIIELFYLCFLCDSHLLLLDVPGVGKTILAKSFSKAVGMEFGRIQGTPDLTPGDILGVNIFHPEESRFQFFKGPVFCNLLLFDEINRTSPKTQSALMEAMAERWVTLDGKGHELPRPFFLVATANPLESMGTFSLPDSQLDRFMIRTTMGYPHPDHEKKLYRCEVGESYFDSISCHYHMDDFLTEKQDIQKVHFEDKLIPYVYSVVEKSRKDESLAIGISPRGAQFWIKAAKATAYLNQRDYVIPDDLSETAVHILSHRLIPRIGGEENSEWQAQRVLSFLHDSPVPF